MDYLNKLAIEQANTIAKIALEQQESLKEDIKKHQQFLVQQEHQLHAIQKQALEIQSSFEAAKAVSVELSTKQIELTDKLEGFYGKQIEMFGLFIAIFSFIIAGIQISTKLDGSPIEMLGKSLALFVPLTFCVMLLLCVIRWTSRR